MLRVGVQLSGQCIQLQCGRGRAILHLVIVNMESSGANHDRLRKSESELQLRIIDRAERRPDCSRDRSHGRVLLFPDHNDLLQSHHLNILSLHHDHNRGSRTGGGGDELGYLLGGI